MGIDTQMQCSYMKTVGSRELKNRLGRYLGLVRRGETIIVTDRGKTVAHLIPPSSEPKDVVSLEAILKQLEQEGHLRRGSGQFKSFKPIPKKGKPASRILLEERD
jgi:prevent-host-death family protein